MQHFIEFPRSTGLIVQLLQAATIAYLFDHVLESDAHALDKLKSLAVEENQPANAYLMILHYDGFGRIASDPDLAKVHGKNILKWLKRLADKGEKQQQYILAWCHERGSVENWFDEEDKSPIIIKKDLESAAKYYAHSAAQHYAPALHALAICYLDGRGLEQDNDLAIDFLQQGVLLAHSGCAHSLAELYANGKAVEKNMVKAVDLYYQAATQGYYPAECELGMILLNGCDGVPADPVEGLRLLNLAAEQNSSTAFYHLGLCHYNCLHGCKCDPEKGCALFLAAAELGHMDAQYEHGYCHETGIGVIKKNYEEAKVWYAKAAAQGHEKAKNRLESKYHL